MSLFDGKTGGRASRPLLMLGLALACLAVVGVAAFAALSDQAETTVSEAPEPAAPPPDQQRAADNESKQDAREQPGGEEAPPIQRRALAVTPDPEHATDDKSRMWHQGCQIDPEVTRSPQCVYGDPDGEVTVVLTGDSHALHYFPAFDRLARERGWRLLGLSKVGCSPYQQVFYNPKLQREYWECLRWQDHIVERMAREEPDLIVMSGGNRVTAMVDGERLMHASPDNRRLLARGFVRYAERLEQASGAEIVIMKDNPYAPHDVPDCVAEELGPDGDLRRCAFNIPPNHERQAFEPEVAERVGATLVNLQDAYCPDGVCRAVIDDILVMRDGNHFTATFSHTMAGRLNAQLPELD